MGIRKAACATSFIRPEQEILPFKIPPSCGFLLFENFKIRSFIWTLNPIVDYVVVQELGHLVLEYTTSNFSVEDGTW